jgi:hypothetical protein
VCEFAPVAEDAAEQSGPESDGAGSVCDFGIESEPDENGEGDQGSAPGNGIDCARGERGAEHDKPGEHAVMLRSAA